MEKQNKILSRLLKDGYITKEEFKILKKYKEDQQFSTKEGKVPPIGGGGGGPIIKP